MKKGKNSVFLCIAIAILSLSILCGCCLIEDLLFGKPDHSFHHDAPVITPSKVLKVMDKQYCIFSRAVYLLKDGKFQRVSTKVTNDPTYVAARDMQTDGEKLFICGDHSLSNGIAVFSSDYEYEGSIYYGQVLSFLLYDNFIYFHEIRHDETSKQEEYYFSKLDRMTNQTEIIFEGYLQNEIVEVDGLKIYANSRSMLYWADETENVNYGNGYNHLNTSPGAYPAMQSLGFYHDGESGTVTTNDCRVSVTYGNKTIFSSQEMEIVLYQRIFVTNGKLNFAAYSFIENENCNNDWCICHYGESIVYEYDFATEELIEKQKTNIREYIISFDAKNLTYYSNGAVLRNDEAIQSVTPIEPLGEYVQWGGGFKFNTEIGLWVFYDDGNLLWYSYYDNSEYIKDEYF